MQGTFLGGAREVGRLGLVLRHRRSRVLLDYGLSPSDPPAYPKSPPPVDAVLLTHAHLDHAGMVPAVAHQQDVPVYATGPTLETTEVLCRDCLKVHRLEGYAAPYQDFAISHLADVAHPILWDDPFQVGQLEVQAVNSGHIPGSSMFRLQGDRSVLFTADLYTAGCRLVPPARPVGCDTLILEGTYSGREHQPREEIEAGFLDKVQSTLDRGGVCVVPCFAVGRTQEVLMVLEEIQAPIWLDGMGKHVTDLFLRHPSFLRDAKALQRMRSRVRKARNHKDRRQACQPGNVIVTTSGMLEGGPVISYLKQLHDDPSSSVLLTGYQVEGTGGRRLLDEGWISLDDQDTRIRCEVEHFDFSGHAGHSELVAFAEACRPETVVICHSDDPDPLVRDIETIADRVIAPSIGETFEIP